MGHEFCVLRWRGGLTHGPLASGGRRAANPHRPEPVALGPGPHRLRGPDGQAALEQLDSREMDLVLLDLVMPRRGGLDVLSDLKLRVPSPPVIVLTAVTEISARIQALDRGAVDVVAKPFSTTELSARIRRHLDQKTPAPSGEQRYLEAGGGAGRAARRRALTAQGPVSLTGREFALLAHLMRRSNDVCSREELLHDIWDLSFDPGSNVVDVCVRRLRAKLQPTPPIDTVRGAGYCFYDE